MDVSRYFKKAYSSGKSGAWQTGTYRDCFKYVSVPSEKQDNEIYMSILRIKPKSQDQKPAALF